MTSLMSDDEAEKLSTLIQEVSVSSETRKLILGYVLPSAFSSKYPNLWGIYLLKSTMDSATQNKVENEICKELWNIDPHDYDPRTYQYTDHYTKLLREITSKYKPPFNFETLMPKFYDIIRGLSKYRTQKDVDEARENMRRKTEQEQQKRQEEEAYRKELVEKGAHREAERKRQEEFREAERKRQEQEAQDKLRREADLHRQREKQAASEKKARENEIRQYHQDNPNVIPYEIAQNVEHALKERKSAQDFITATIESGGRQDRWAGETITEQNKILADCRDDLLKYDLPRREDWPLLFSYMKDIKDREQEQQEARRKQEEYENSPDGRRAILQKQIQDLEQKVRTNERNVLDDDEVIRRVQARKLRTQNLIAIDMETIQTLRQKLQLVTGQQPNWNQVMSRLDSLLHRFEQ